MKLLYRTSEAKAALGVGTTTLYRWINEGRLDARKMGRRTYITGDSIEALVESLEPVVTPTMKAAGQPQEAGERQSPRSRFTFVAPRPVDAT